MDVAIFGAGIAGLVTAISLQARGHCCRLYERSLRDDSAGMGFILMPHALSTLGALGVNLSEAGIPLQGYRHRNRRGEIVSEQRMPAGARSIRRSDLMAALAKAMPRAETTAFGAGLDRMELDRDGRVIAACLDSGERIRADLYVGADGVRSKARSAVFPAWSMTPARVVEIVGLVRGVHARRWGGRSLDKFHAEDGGIAMGCLPVDVDHVVWYVQFDSRRFPPPGPGAEARRSFVDALVGNWAHPVPGLVAASDFSQVHVWRPVDMDLLPRFHHANLVLVGDAAHPLLPFTSQGVSSAIADALSLADALEAEDDLDDALTAYSVERRHQCAPYIAKGRELTRNFLAPASTANALLPLAQ